jgi:hypothetical protein
MTVGIGRLPLQVLMMSQVQQHLAPKAKVTEIPCDLPLDNRLESRYKQWVISAALEDSDLFDYAPGRLGRRRRRSVFDAAHVSAVVVTCCSRNRGKC